MRRCPAWQDGQYSNLVANHYPAQTVAPKPGQVRVNPHTDHGGITILQVDDAPGGLEVAYDRVGLAGGDGARRARSSCRPATCSNG